VCVANAGKYFHIRLWVTWHGHQHLTNRERSIQAAMTSRHFYGLKNRYDIHVSLMSVLGIQQMPPMVAQPYKR